MTAPPRAALVAALAAVFIGCGGEGPSKVETPVSSTPNASDSPKDAPSPEPAIPTGWVWVDGMGWRCALPAAATFSDPGFAEPGVRGQVASVQLGDGTALAVTVGQRHGGAGVGEGEEHNFFAGVRDAMQFSGRTSPRATLQRNGHTCVAEESTGTLGATQGDLLLLVCEDRIMVFVWRGVTPTRLADVVKSCRFSPIAP